MNIQIVSANEWIYTDSKVEISKKTSFQLNVARGSFACFQIVADGCQNGIIRCKAKKEKNTFIHWVVNRLIPVYVGQNTGPKGFTVREEECAKDYTTRQAPFWVYDAMEPINEETKFHDTDSNLGLYIIGRIPEEISSGKYSEEFELSIGEELKSFCVEIKVYPAIVPQKENLQIIQWFSVKNMAVYHQLELWSEEHWTMIKKYGQLMRHARQTHFWINKEVYEVKCLGDGKYEFDFTRAKRLIEMYLDLGFCFIESGMAIEREKYEDSTFIIRINDGYIKALSTEGKEYLHSFFQALREFLVENDWLTITIQHVADEPHKKCLEEYRLLAEIVKRECPDIKLFDAVETTDLKDALDVYCPQNHYYEENRELFESFRRQGKGLWFYTCCKPGGHYLNRLLDFPLIRTRYLHWGNAFYHIEGYLHWGFNYFDWTDDPYQGKAGGAENLGETQLPPGDTHIVYPGKNGPLCSVRLEAMRAGCEDYELFLKLEKENKELFYFLLNKCVRSFSDFTEDMLVFQETYKALLEAVSLMEKQD